MKQYIELLISVILLILAFALEQESSIYTQVLKDFKNTNFLLGLILIILFIVLATTKNILEREKEHQIKLQESIKKAILGLVIAYLAHLDLKLVPFWLLFIMSFFFHDWV